MKIFLSFMMLFSLSFLNAQGDSAQNLGVTQNSTTSMLTASNGMKSSYGSLTTFVNPKKEVLGSVYLFDEWKNYGIIYTIDNHKFRLNNINLNIQRNTFVAKVANDSIFTFNFNNIKKFVINNKTYKNIYSKNGKRVYEVIHESDKYSLLKGFDIQLISGSPNPMVNRSNDKYVRKHSYYVHKNNQVELFKFKKKNIMKLLGEDADMKSKISTYIENNKLSYKKAGDMKKALSYINKE